LIRTLGAFLALLGKAPKTGLSAPIFVAVKRQQSISASIPCAAKNRHPWRRPSDAVRYSPELTLNILREPHTSPFMAGLLIPGGGYGS
jgi:hypothetical protein